MEQNFEKAFEFVTEHEGGYIADPRDPGGETNFGISKKAYPDLDIKELTFEEAKAIYKRDYWDKLKCDEIASGLDIVAFDTAVNFGINRVFGYLKLTHDWRDFLFLRLGYYANLDIAKYFMVGWTRRVIDLWNLVKFLKE